MCLGPAFQHRRGQETLSKFSRNSGKLEVSGGVALDDHKQPLTYHGALDRPDPLEPSVRGRGS